MRRYAAEKKEKFRERLARRERVPAFGKIRRDLLAVALRRKRAGRGARTRSLRPSAVHDGERVFRVFVARLRHLLG